ncbi:MAG TPA: hypothetical protein VNV15_08580 [Opitutaceae bacterium]|jgi:hypothetical protein|nr:hypothetical protein [Opitutaceae bacterium]
MAQLYLHNQEVATVFDLLGDKENDVTFSLGWALTQSPSFRRRLLKNLFPGKDAEVVTDIQLQKHGGRHGGYTDIEIITDRSHIIIEAKRGMVLPGEVQLRKYVPRFKNTRLRAIVVMAEREPNLAQGNLPKSVRSVPVGYRSWKQVTRIAQESVASEARHDAKRLLRQFARYMEGLIDMQNQKSNEVYVVALGSAHKAERWWDGSWREFVTSQRTYFQPTTVRWPKPSPNYLGFRYDGKLQSIHHIDKMEAVDSLKGHIRAHSFFGWMKKPHLVCKLGPPIRPAREVRSGNIMNRRMMAALDLLLTCRNVTEASKKTKKRLLE